MKWLWAKKSGQDVPVIEIRQKLEEVEVQQALAQRARERRSDLLSQELEGRMAWAKRPEQEVGHVITLFRKNLARRYRQLRQDREFVEEMETYLYGIQQRDK